MTGPDEGKLNVQPVLKWPGGKRWLASSLAPIIRDELSGTYYEPFVGGGAVFLSLRPKRVVLSDINESLISFLTTLRSHPEDVLRAVWRWSNTAWQSRPATCSAGETSTERYGPFPKLPPFPWASCSYRRLVAKTGRCCVACIPRGASHKRKGVHPGVARTRSVGYLDDDDRRNDWGARGVFRRKHPGSLTAPQPRADAAGRLAVTRLQERPWALPIQRRVSHVMSGSHCTIARVDSPHAEKEGNSARAPGEGGKLRATCPHPDRQARPDFACAKFLGGYTATGLVVVGV